MIRSQLLLLIMAVFLCQEIIADILRTPSGKPDLSGVYDTGTLTPTQRPGWLGETEYLYPFVARFLNWVFSVGWDQANSVSDPDREAPELGGDGNNAAGAGGVLTAG